MTNATEPLTVTVVDGAYLFEVGPYAFALTREAAEASAVNLISALSAGLTAPLDPTSSCE